MQIAYQTQNLIVLVNIPSETAPDPFEDGLIVGKIFPRVSGSKNSAPPSCEISRSVDGRSKNHLISSYWGSYIHVACIGSKTVIFRDPSGGLPCYYISNENLTAFASDAPILVNAGLFRPSVDTEVVGRTLYFNQLPMVTTAIVGLSQLLPGHEVTLQGRGTQISQLWNPWDHIASDPSESLMARSEHLERVVRSTHDAWAKCYPHSLVGLSGGLDSSIVAICLARASSKVDCLTAITSDPVGDERLYARMVCEQIGTRLFEEEYSGDAIDLDRSVAEGVPVPNGKSHEMAYNHAVREAAHRLNVDAFFVGAGGDNVFYLTHSARPLVDRYYAEGISKGLYPTLSDICAITGASVWQVLAEALRLGIRGRAATQTWHVDPDYLDAEFIAGEVGRPIDHPWLIAPGDAPLGKLGHVAMILRAMNHIEHRDKNLSVPMVSPLLSQPIVETCLGIPSWEACHGGVDRSAARRAFSTSLPPRVVGRHGKGSPDGFVGGFIHRHRAEIAERLLCGRLAENRLVDRVVLESTLRPGASLQRNDCARIMELLDAEAWIYHWSSLSDDSV